jgi:hypothetical protein
MVIMFGANNAPFKDHSTGNIYRSSWSAGRHRRAGMRNRSCVPSNMGKEKAINLLICSNGVQRSVHGLHEGLEEA